MHSQIITSIPFPEVNDDLLFHVLCTFPQKKLCELAKMNGVTEARNKYSTALNIVDHKKNIKAVLNVLE